jgi:RNA polymerase sporulation-specific sigma factor
MEGLAERIKLAHEGDKSARDRLVSDNLGLVYLVVRRFENRGHDREELFQIGCIGLMKAIDKFDTTMEVTFSTYAVPVITGEIRRFLRDDGMIHISRTLKENGSKVSRTKEWLSGELGREPTLVEVAAATELSVEDIVLAMEANRQVESIYQPAYGSEGEEVCLIDRIGGAEEGNYREEPEKEAVLNRMVVNQMLEKLEEQERKLIRLRYFEGKTQSEVAAVLGMTQVQVSRMEKKILYRMRETLET